MATLQGKAVKNTYRQVLQIGANNVGVSGTLQPVQDGAGVNTALSLSTLAATVNGDLTITGDLIITGGGLQIKELIDDTVANLIKNGTGITWTYNDAGGTLTGNFTGTTSVVPEGSNLYYTQGRFDSAFAAKSTTNLAEGTNLYFTTARGNANFATNLAASDTDDLAEGATNLYFTNARARTALSVTAGTGLSYNNTTGVFNLAAIPNASLTNSSITINGQAVSLGGSVTLTTTNIAEGTNLYWTEARGNSNFATNLAASTTTNLAEGTNLYYTQARFDTAFSNKSTTNLAEGTNLYYTQARFNSALAAKTTTDLAEGTNLYYTDARARLALSSSATGLSYANNSGVFSLTAGYAIPTTVKLGQYDIAYNRSIVSAAVTGTSTKTLSLTQQDANVITATWTDQGITTINGTANQIAATTVGNTTTIGFTNDVTMPNNLVVSGNLTINGTATYVNTESISSKDPLFEVANTNNTTDAVDIGYYGRYYDAVQERVEFTGLFRDASDAGKFKIFTGLVDEPTNVVNTTGTGYTVATLVANVDGNLNGTANAANILSTARTIAASGDATWSVSFNGSANVTSALTLANTGVTATTYGTSTAVPTIAVDSKGRITSASNTNITFPVTTVNGFAGTVVLTTSDVAEGTNQYFTTARAQASITGGASSVVTANLTASRALVSDGSGKIAASATTTTTEIGYLAGVTSAIQTQLNGKLNLTGGTLTGGLIGTTGSFSSSGSGDTFTIGHTSGSGIALNITKGGNGEGLYVNKTSGSGNAVTIVGNLGGTTASFSGLLSGTSATFSSTISALSFTSTGVSNGSGRVNVQDQDGRAAAFISPTPLGGVASIGSTTNHDFRINTGDFNALYLGTKSGVNWLTFATTGAATFNSGTSLSAAFNSTTNNPYIRFDQSGAAKLFIGERSAVSGSTGTGYDLYTAAGNDLRFFTNSSSNAALTIATTGAATFSSSIRANAASTIYGATQDAIQTIFTLGGQNASAQAKELYFRLTASGTPQWTLQTASVGADADINIYPSGANGLKIAYSGAATFSSSVTSATKFISSVGNNNIVFESLSATTGFQYMQLLNTTAHTIFGIEGTAAGSLLTGGLAYGSVFTSVGNTALQLGTNQTARLTITSGGDVGIGDNTAAGYKINIVNASSVPYGMRMYYSSVAPNITGDNQFIICADTSNSKFAVWSSGTVQNRTGVYGTLSDETLKENIVDTTPKLDNLLKLKVRNFNFIGEDLKQLGFVAQEMEEVFPNMVDTDKEGIKSVKTTVLIPMLVKAMQEQQAQIEELKAMIAAK